MSTANEILDFWFGTSKDAEYGNSRQVWFAKNSEFDQEITTRFLPDYQLAATRQLDSWKNTPVSCLALIILLDQFPRNMFRNRPETFATDSLALSIAQQAIAQNFDRQLLPIQRLFIYLPFEHSEDLQHQRQAVELLRQLKEDAGYTNFFDYALRHLAIIERFGRFPHRNQILGRVSTPEEEEFLKQPGSGF